MSPTRREFLTGTAALVAANAMVPRQALTATLVHNARYPRTVIGYCWPQTVRPGESLDVMVSTYARGPYKAELVRIICADNLSDPAIYKEEELTAPFVGSYPGRHQPIHIGSYVEINPNKLLDQLGSFTVQTMLYPTLLPGIEIFFSDEGAIMSNVGEQYLVSRWDDKSKQGWGLLIDKQGQLAFVLGDGKQVHRTNLDKPFLRKQWFSVMASYDAKTRRIRVTAEIVADSPADKIAWPKQAVDEACTAGLMVIHQGPLRFAACYSGPGNKEKLKPGACFNGKLDRVRLTAGALTAQQAATLNRTRIPKKLRKQVLGFWDFGKGIDTINIIDLSRNKLHGLIVNAPMRAVTGVDWNGSEDDWRQAPDHYSAIYFHDDDLYDAEWESDFSYRVPEDLPSSIYAVRIRHGKSEDYIPFFVAPSKHKTTAKLALLLPTTTYNAYTNRNMYFQTIPEQATDGTGRFNDIENDPIWPVLRQNAEDAWFLQKHMPELGKGVYFLHTDGSRYEISSQKHPNINAKPKSVDWTLVPDTYIVDWLEHVGIDYDIITDDLLQEEGGELLKNYTVVMTGNHPEYVSTEMLNAVVEYQETGGRLMYLGGNGFYHIASYHRHLPGVIEVRRSGFNSSVDAMHFELRHAADGVIGGKWKDVGRPANRYVGVHYIYSGLKKSDAYKRLPDSYDPRAAFIFAGVNNDIIGDYGILGGGAAGHEFDHINYEWGTPAHAMHLARAPFSEAAAMNCTANIENECAIHGADMVYFELPDGGAVFTPGSMAWVGALSHNNYDNDVARITENVLRRFLDKTPLALP